MNDEYTYEEAAKVLGVTVGTLRVAITKSMLHSIKHPGIKRKFLSKKEVDAKVGKVLIPSATVTFTEHHYINSESVDINIRFIAEQFRLLEEKHSHRVMELSDKDAHVTLQLANDMKEALIEYIRTGRVPDSVKGLQNTITDNPDEYFERAAKATDDLANLVGAPTPGISGPQFREHYDIMAKYQQENQKGEYL